MSTKTELEIFCINMLILRVKHRLPKREMAKILGIGISSLRRIESGEVPLGMSCLAFFKASRYFGIPVSRLFEPLPGMEPFYEVS